MYIVKEFMHDMHLANRSLVESTPVSAHDASLRRTRGANAIAADL